MCRPSPWPSLVVQPWTLDVFSAFTGLTELSVSLHLRHDDYESSQDHTVLNMTESLTGMCARLWHAACKQTCFPNERADGLVAGLQKLRHLEVHGSKRHSLAEQKPGLLNKVLEGVTRLLMRARSVDCSDIASPNLRCLTVIIYYDHQSGQNQDLQGVNGPSSMA